MQWSKRATPATTASASKPSSAGKREGWSRVLESAKWELGSEPRDQQTGTRLRSGRWLLSAWRKTAHQFRSNMRWGSLSYIARAWEEQSTTTDICSAADGRAKADSSTCSNNNEAIQGPENAGGTDATNPAVVASFLRRRAPQGLAFALVVATVYVVYRRRRRRPGGRPRSRRQVGERRSDVAAAAARQRWWQRAGGKEAERKGDGGGSSIGGGGGDTRDVAERANDTRPGLAKRSDEDVDGEHAVGGKSVGGKEEEMDGRMDVGEEGTRKGTSEHDEPGPTACPSPEHDREGNDVGKVTHAGVRTDGQQQDDVSSDGAIQGGGQPSHSAEEQDSALARMSRGQSLLSESSTEDILAEADHLIADAANNTFNSIRAMTTPTKPRAGKLRATSKATGPIQAARRKSKDSPRGTPSLKLTLSRMTSASRSSDTRSPKRPRVYPEVSGEEVDALVSLTHRALERDPSALSEIAKDASLQQGGDK
ncbi:unnamed protein product [Ectocarpus sp. CCAP 1310/34]|nr:unnamed protein product [Ectocarpus sp. CCAP 1310/34]